ncbi:3121_t:CDS:2 [Ambispora gerdemannii]|uniref:3121_t:CDS:1 n=1 Tax=Ambispora gerdemannii TaxID=144530 RepID=A0A9N8WR54_9GLOM|nr:3121_t:CDS:2 [Ambispora gerdemannii]
MKNNTIPDMEKCTTCTITILYPFAALVYMYVLPFFQQNGIYTCDVCLHKIFKYFCVSEGEECDSNELNNNRQQLFRFALVNRHWCDTAIPLLWRRPFPLISANANAVFISTLLNCFDNNDNNELEAKPLFHYNIFIKQITWQKFKRYHNQQESRKNDAPESHFKTFKAICHNLIDSPVNFFFEITIDYNYNIFQITNSKASLGRSLKISLIDGAELLNSASKTCLNLSTLEIIASLSLICHRGIYPEYWIFYDYHDIDQFINELGLSIPGYLRFSADSLNTFLHGVKVIHFKSLEFPQSYISEEHLEFILKAIKDSNLDVGIQQIETSMTSN